MNESLYKPREEVQPAGNFVKNIGFRPKKAPIFSIIIGLALLLFRNFYASILGIFFIAMALFVLFEVKERKVMDIFDQGIMLYGDHEAKMACFIGFDRIREWGVDHKNGHDTLEFDLDDGNVIYVDTFEADSAFRVLYGLIKEKEKSFLRNKEEKGLTVRDIFNGIKKRISK